MYVKSPEVIDCKEHEKNTQLDRKRDEIGKGDRNGDDQPVKIDFAEQGGIPHKGAGGFIDIIREITPHHVARKIEEKRRHAIR